MQIAQILANRTRESQQFRIGFPVGPRAIFERNSECFRRFACDSRLEKNVTRRRCNKAEDGDDRPCQNPRLPTGKPRDHLASAGESLLHVAPAMKEIVETLRKGPGSC